MTQKENKQKQTNDDPERKEVQNMIIEQKIINGDGEVMIKKYRRGKILGKGGFARCYEATNIETKKIYAIKIVNKATLKKPKAKQKLVTEIKIHKILRHKHVVSFDHVFEDEENVYILLELCTHQTLSEMIKKRKRISELQLQYYLLQLIQGLTYIHSAKVIHRDLKLGNLMIGENMEIKIGDFGLAAKLQNNNQKRRTVCGTPNYIAPQILQGKGHSYEVDAWSVGVIMYALLYGRPPFQTSDVKKTYKRIKQSDYTFNDEINISNNARSLITKLLVCDVSKRFTLKQILEHPFMNSNKVPKKMPNYILSSPLSRDFVEDYVLYSNTKPLFNSKSSDKVESDEKNKLGKGISERHLLRSSTKFSRNIFSRQIKEQQIINQKSPLLSNNFLNENENPKLKQSVNQACTVFVKKWVDYSSKYGLGYLLSDGTTGIYFNDCSKIVSDQLNQKIDYLGKIKGQTKLYSFTSQNLPEDRQISKKITLMQYFKKYLNGIVLKPQNSKRKQTDPPFLYVKRWIKTQNGILFRLNNKLIQVNFTDKSQIVMYGDKGILVYTSPNNAYKSYYELGVNQIPRHSEAFQKLEQVKLMLQKIQDPQPNHTLQFKDQFDRENLKNS